LKKWQIISALVVGAMFSSIGSAQTVKKKITPDEREIQMQELANLEKENARAIQLNNPSFFQASYADEFNGVTSFGQPVDKNGFIRLVQNSGIAFSRVLESDIQIKMYLDAASVLSMRSERGTQNGKTINRQFRVMRVYIYTPRGWKVVSQLEAELPDRLQH
jgi:hypothetical protein